MSIWKKNTEETIACVTCDTKLHTGHHTEQQQQTVLHNN